MGPLTLADVPQPAVQVLTVASYDSLCVFTDELLHKAIHAFHIFDDVAMRSIQFLAILFGYAASWEHEHY